MADIYMNLNYDDYKSLEEQLRNWAERETAHTTVDGFYHKSLSFRVAGIRFEFHGPNVKAAEPIGPIEVRVPYVDVSDPSVVKAIIDITRQEMDRMNRRGVM